MLFALGAAALARFDAGAELGASELEVGAGETRNDTRRREANVGAINAMADTRNLISDILLPKTGVRAGVARFSARVTGGDALDVHRVVRGRMYRMGFEHLCDIAHGDPFIEESQRLRTAGGFFSSKRRAGAIAR